MTDFGRLWRTVRHLKPIQVYGRLWFRFKKPRFNLPFAPGLRAPGGTWHRVPARTASLTDPQRFRFLNVEYESHETGWDNPSLPKLWRYNLHYFDDLQAHDWRDRAAWHHALIARWIEENPPGQGSGWEPYPLSLRIVNWIKWHLASGGLSSEAQQSLALQVNALSQKLEWHLLGNHLFVNAKALLFAGHFFDGPDAAAWRKKGLKVLEAEIEEQFLPDGGHFELSTMYHALALEDLLDLLNLNRCFPGLMPEEFVAKVKARAQSARTWLDRLSHPDGRISFFNDAAFNIAPENSELETYADSLGIAKPLAPDPLVHLPQSGYARLAAGPAVLIADLARIGPDYLPGHAHADSLSFELSVFEQRVFVNSGTGEYGISPERLRQRSTAAHNTVVLEGHNSSEVWGGFRVGRRAKVHDIELSQQDGTITAAASHNGYSHLPGRPKHHRHFLLTDTGLRVTDQLSSSIAAEARFHLHPEVRFVIAGTKLNLLLPDGQSLLLKTIGGALRCEPSTWHPEFGLDTDTNCLVLPLSQGQATLELCWA